jgi:hypothetical protein
MQINTIQKLFVALSLVVLCATGGLAQDQAGSAVEETVDLKSFQTRSGRTLFEAMKEHSVAMIVIVDPSCGTCAKDSLRSLRDRVEKTQIAYYVVMIPDGTDPAKYFSFADSLNLDVESFIWNNANAKPGSLGLMTKPSHLQISNEGLIVKKWTGVP